MQRHLGIYAAVAHHESLIKIVDKVIDTLARRQIGATQIEDIERAAAFMERRVLSEAKDKRDVFPAVIGAVNARARYEYVVGLFHEDTENIKYKAGTDTARSIIADQFEIRKTLIGKLWRYADDRGIDGKSCLDERAFMELKAVIDETYILASK